LLFGPLTLLQCREPSPSLCKLRLKRGQPSLELILAKTSNQFTLLDFLTFFDRQFSEYSRYLKRKLDSP
jgi:hypothetical protein